MKTKIKKFLNLMCAILILLTAVLPNLGIIASEVFASSSTVQYNGKIKYGVSSVGDFLINGEQAFCMEHSKGTPGTNTPITSRVYDNENVAKCLYYRMGRRRTLEWIYFTSNGNCSNFFSLGLFL